ncbi:MAG: GPH family glycoside/pentoside/hexuronide:cation symporter [Candidatus Krumholzibacteriia bacterium]
MKSSLPASERLGFKEKVGYGLGDTASNFFFQTFNIFLLSYYIDVIGLTAAAIGTMFFVTKIFDAFSDVGMGLLADRTRTRFGRFRPYILWLAIPYGLIGYSMFANPDLSSSGKLIYAYITYSLMMLAYTAINVPYSSLMGVMSPHSEERTRLAMYRFVGAFGAALLISGFVLPLRDLLGGGDEARGYQLTMALFAIISTTLWFVTFATTRERITPLPDQATDLRGDIRETLRNGPWLALVASALFVMMNVAVRAGSTLFYLKYYVPSSGQDVFWIFDRASIFFMSGTAAMLLGTVLTGLFTPRFEKRTVMIVLTSLNAIGMAVFYYIPANEYGLMLAVNFLSMLIVGPTPAIVWSMYADCADYGEWKRGRRTTGLVFSGALFAQKSGLAIGAGLSGWMLSLFGFVANTTQSDTSLLGIRLMFSVFPALLALLAAAALVFYPLRDRDIPQMERELAARRVGDGLPGPTRNP